MSSNLHLPDWPAPRLVYEAAVAWNFRHLDEEPLDMDTAPWPVIRGAVRAFLRHTQTDYDDRLRCRCEHDPVYRDQLADQIALAAKRKYPWLDNDPRPFPEEEPGDSLIFDRMAKHLADLHGLRDQMLSASRDLRRSGGEPDHVRALRSEVDEVNRRIRRLYSFLAAPKTAEEGTAGRALALNRSDGPREYFFHSDSELPPNRIDYTGIRCPRCQASVAQRKGFVSLGQGYDRMVIWSCFCLTYLVYVIPKRRVRPITVERWAQLVGHIMAPGVKEEVSL
jgi:hypothetical protein